MASAASDSARSTGTWLPSLALGIRLGRADAMGTNALHGRKLTAQGAKAGRVPGETLQRGDGRFRQQPGGNECHEAPPCVVLLAKTLGLRLVGRLDWRPMPPVRVC